MKIVCVRVLIIQQALAKVCLSMRLGAEKWGMAFLLLWSGYKGTRLSSAALERQVV